MEPPEEKPTDTIPSKRRIAHLDMDAFYASVELLRRPDLKGKAVAIGGRGNPNSRGVVTTATYTAREFGIRSGMALRKAALLCPDCIFLPTDFDLYRRYSRQFKAAVADVTPLIEDRGIDEIYVDLTNVPGASDNNGLNIANSLRKRVLESTGGLTCSIGLAPNKLIAKIASDLNKPDGVAIIDADQVQTILWPMPARKINGVGPKADQKLQQLGITSIGELAAANPQILAEKFGLSYGRWLHDAAWGRDDRPLVIHSEPVSRSRETTFERDLHLSRDWPELATHLAGLCRQVAADLHKRGYTGRTIGIKVRLDNFKTITRDVSFDRATANADNIRRAAFNCLSRVPVGHHRLRLIGVRVANLEKSGEQPRNDNSPAAPNPDSADTNPVSFTRDLFDNDDP